MMHEVSVVSGIIDAAVAELKNHNVTKVDELTVIIGDLTSLGEEQMQFAYEVMIKDTPLEGSIIRFEREPVNLRCKCGFEGPADTISNDFYNHVVPVLSCPECKGGVEITSGQTCRIKSMTVQEED